MAYRHLIRFHPCLVPIENQCEYFYRMHSFTTDVLKKNDPDAAEFIFKNILCSTNWEANARCNRYLVEHLNHATYDPTNIEEEPARLHRDCVCHDLEYAVSQAQSQQLLIGNEITRTDMARILYSIFSLLQINLAESLYCLGELQNLALASLFSSHHYLNEKAYNVDFQTSSDED